MLCWHTIIFVLTSFSSKIQDAAIVVEFEFAFDAPTPNSPLTMLTTKRSHAGLTLAACSPDSLNALPPNIKEILATTMVASAASSAVVDGKVLFNTFI